MAIFILPISVSRLKGFSIWNFAFRAARFYFSAVFSMFFSLSRVLL